MKKQIYLLSLFVLLFTYQVSSLSARQGIELNCGDILEAETSPNQTVHEYILNASAGTSINLRVEPLSPTFNVGIEVFDGGGSRLSRINAYAQGLAEVVENFVLPSSNLRLHIGGHFPTYENVYGFDDYLGAYTIYLGCTLRDGTVIEPGDTPIESNHSQIPTFSGFGFSGLAAQDFIDGVFVPFVIGEPNIGRITANFNSVFGYTLNATESETFTLDFTRVSGNLSLALAVLSPDSETVFQAILVTSDMLSTRFTLPSTGQYTIGVYKIDLLPPDSPEPTAFQITGTLNP
jgi:hypothetical protein